MKAKNLCIIQSRAESTRLPGKVLMKVKGMTMLEYQVKRLRLSKYVHKIVIATTTRKADDRIAVLCKKIGAACFRGSEDDVLDRYYQCALKYKDYENIIRVTGDCPLIDPRVIDDFIIFFENHKKIDFVGNVMERTFPHGLDVEIFKREVLRESAKKALSSADREHVDEYILNNRRFKKANLTAIHDFSHFRLALDYKEDFAIIKFLIENSKIEDGYLKYVSLLSRNPHIMFKNIDYNIESHFLKSWVLFKKDFVSTMADSRKTFVVLGGALMKDSAGNWRTTNFNEGDNFGISGDKLRIRAADLLVKSLGDKANFLIIASGGKGQYKDIPGAPTVSAVIKKELIGLGVPANQIIEENKSGNTYQQLMALKKMIKEKRLQNVIIISNKHHLPRLKTFIGYDAELKQMSRQSNIGLKLVAAEDILLKYEPTVWQKTITEAYASKAMKKRIALEKRGVRQIKAGTYKFV